MGVLQLVSGGRWRGIFYQPHSRYLLLDGDYSVIVFEGTWEYPQVHSSRVYVVFKLALFVERLLPILFQEYLHLPYQDPAGHDVGSTIPPLDASLTFLQQYVQSKGLKCRLILYLSSLRFYRFYLRSSLNCRFRSPTASPSLHHLVKSPHLLD